ncbi:MULTISPECIES: recombinase family protein [Clostridium]|jgi:DNA invertase Pin-like site-specific DNA recombinase|nr:MULTISPECIES: recombinase family protein [Clostridium]MDY4607281.1 recombinase family protein [Clostridium tertium]
MKNKVFGYTRVSSKEQNEARQIKSIKEYCKNIGVEIDERDIFVDKQSGKDFKRDKYQILKQMLRSGDIVIIKELDRLGRNKSDIKKEIEWFKESEITLRILDIPTTLIELSQYDGGIAKAMMDMINNVLIEVLGTIAEEERKKIKKRQAEGIEIAKSQGKHLGRPKTEFPVKWEEQYTKWKAGEITATNMMDQLGLKRNTFYRLVKKYEGK